MDEEEYEYVCPKCEFSTNSDGHSVVFCPACKTEAKKKE